MLFDSVVIAPSGLATVKESDELATEFAPDSFDCDEAPCEHPAKATPHTAAPIKRGLNLIVSPILHCTPYRYIGAISDNSPGTNAPFYRMCCASRFYLQLR